MEKKELEKNGAPNIHNSFQEVLILFRAYLSRTSVSQRLSDRRTPEVLLSSNYLNQWEGQVLIHLLVIVFLLNFSLTRISPGYSNSLEQKGPELCFHHTDDITPILYLRL